MYIELVVGEFSPILSMGVIVKFCFVLLHYERKLTFSSFTSPLFSSEHEIHGRHLMDLNNEDMKDMGIK